MVSAPFHPLSAAFVSRIPVKIDVPEGLGEAIAHVAERGRAAHPDLPLDLEVFAADLGLRIFEPYLESLAAMHAEDMFLVVACQTSARARTRIRAALDPLLPPIVAHGAYRDDAAAATELLWAVLFSNDERRSLLRYPGHRPLTTWIIGAALLVFGSVYERRPLWRLFDLDLAAIPEDVRDRVGDAIVRSVQAVDDTVAWSLFSVGLTGEELDAVPQLQRREGPSPSEQVAAGRSQLLAALAASIADLPQVAAIMAELAPRVDELFAGVKLGPRRRP